MLRSAVTGKNNFTKEVMVVGCTVPFIKVGGSNVVEYVTVCTFYMKTSTATNM